MKNSNFIVDYYTGCVGKQVKNNRDDLRMVMWNVKNEVANANTPVTSLILHPVKKSCAATCYYCYVGANKRSVNKDDFLTIDILDKKLQAVNEYNKSLGFGDEIICVKMTGGEPLLHDKMEEIFEHLNAHINSKFFITISTSLFIPKPLYERFKKLLMKLDSYENISKVQVYYSMNFGNKVDLGKSVIGEPDHYRIDDLIRLKLEHNINKLCFTLHNVVLKETDFDLFLKEFRRYIKGNEDFIDSTFTLVKEGEYLCDLDKFMKFLSDIEELDTQPYVSYWASIHLNGKFKHNDFKNEFYEQEEGIYKWSPFNDYCGMFKSSLVIDKDTYCSCFHKITDAETIEEATNAKCHPNKEQVKLFFTLSDKCKDCELLSFCNRCRLDRHNLECSKQYKEYERLRFRLFAKQVAKTIGGGNNE
jgi:organic radical activating enzyme